MGAYITANKSSARQAPL